MGIMLEISNDAGIIQNYIIYIYIKIEKLFMLGMNRPFDLQYDMVWEQVPVWARRIW